jgi:hypothetical protein
VGKRHQPGGAASLGNEPGRLSFSPQETTSHRKGAEKQSLNDFSVRSTLDGEMLNRQDAKSAKRTTKFFAPSACFAVEY